MFRIPMSLQHRHGPLPRAKPLTPVPVVPVSRETIVSAALAKKKVPASRQPSTHRSIGIRNILGDFTRGNGPSCSVCGRK